MTIKQIADELVGAALGCTDEYIDAIQAAQLASLMLQDALENINVNAGRIADLIVAGKIEEARELSRSYGLELTWDDQKTQ